MNGALEPQRKLEAGQGRGGLPAAVSAYAARCIRTKVSPSAGRIYRALHEVALVVAGARGYVAGVSQVSFFVPAEVVAHALGMHRATLYRHLPRLKELGLVDARAHRTTYNGRVVADGTVWSVKLRPFRGKSARVSIEDLKHKWRDLAWDVLHGRTAYNVLESVPAGGTHDKALEMLTQWALSDRTQPTPSASRTPSGVAAGLECVLDVPFAVRPARSGAVDLAARSACALLDDDSVNFYRWLLWQLLRLHDRGQDYFPGVHLLLERALTDQREGFARSAGALFVSRLKRWQAWELIRATPPWSVGARPAH